ncbi:MAG: hypothetical protein K5770_17130 [Lachnospiraceae bacterium]|nr:hypothetical protein [Lachnospiraceae bacterium]
MSTCELVKRIEDFVVAVRGGVRYCLKTNLLSGELIHETVRRSGRALAPNCFGIDLAFDQNGSDCFETVWHSSHGLLADV